MSFGKKRAGAGIYTNTSTQQSAPTQSSTPTQLSLPENKLVTISGTILSITKKAKEFEVRIISVNPHPPSPSTSTKISRTAHVDNTRKNITDKKAKNLLLTAKPSTAPSTAAITSALTSNKFNVMRWSSEISPGFYKIQVLDKSGRENESIKSKKSSILDIIFNNSSKFSSSSSSVAVNDTTRVIHEFSERKYIGDSILTLTLQ